MAIRDRVRRALHRSDDSSTFSQSSSNTTGATTATASSSEASSTSTNSSLRHQTSKFFSSWRSHDKAAGGDADKERKRKKKTKPVHPRDRPLTTTNLRHQEMLSQFTMTFGSSASRLSQVIVNDFDFDSVSPCCTRAPSLCGDFDYNGTTTDGTATSIDEPLGAS